MNVQNASYRFLWRPALLTVLSVAWSLAPAGNALPAGHTRAAGETLSAGHFHAAGAVAPQLFSPSLSFTLASFRAGDFDSHCQTEVDARVAYGFKTVTVVPMLAWNVEKGTLASPEQTLRPGELARCLEYAWNAGLHIAFQPHVDDPEFKVWRAEFDVIPDERYRHGTFDAFEGWLKGKVAELNAGKRRVDVVLAAELERSVARHGTAWVSLTSKLRQDFAALGIQPGGVRIGYNPNWSPLRSMGRSPDCAGMQAFVAGVDFLSWSGYGDWSDTTLGPTQISQQLQQLEYSLGGRYGCDLWEILAHKPATFGEFGSGFYLWASYYWGKESDPTDIAVKTAILTTPGPVQDAYRAQRQQLFDNLFDYYQTPRQSLPDLPLNLWTIGSFDPVGFHAPPGEGLPDPKILKRMKVYSGISVP